MDGGPRQLRSSTQKSKVREHTDRVIPSSMRKKDSKAAPKTAAAKKRGGPKKRNGAGEAEATGTRQTATDLHISDDEWDVADYRERYIHEKARADRLEEEIEQTAEGKFDAMAEGLRHTMDQLITVTLQETQEMLQRQQQKTDRLQEKYDLEIRELRKEIEKRPGETRERGDQQKEPSPKRPMASKRIIRHLEKVDLLSPPGSPKPRARDVQERESSTAASRGTAQSSKAKMPAILSAPPKLARAMERPIPVLMSRATDISVGVEHCPEARLPVMRISPRAKQTAERNSDREKTSSTHASPSAIKPAEKNSSDPKTPSTRTSPPAGRSVDREKMRSTPVDKRSVDDEINLVYTKGKSPIQSQALAATRRAINRAISRSPFRRSMHIASSYDLFPGLELFGFERQLISKNEIVYKHDLTQEIFAFLSEDFLSEEKEMQFQPMTHGELWRCLPDQLKDGEVLFKRAELKNFASVIVRCMVDYYNGHPSKKPCVRKSI